MPIKRRRSKARAGEAKAWAMYMQSGHDFFDDLADLGLDEKTAAPVAEEAWHRIGRDVIDHIERIHHGYHPPERPFWAEERFGRPGGR